jgi:hypothetical protein
MAKKNRNSLKNAFREGAQPSAESFGDLIDSVLNVVDEGFEKTDGDGFKITQLGGKGKLISFYENLSVHQPAWSMRLGRENRQLIVGDENGEPALTLLAGRGEKPAARIGINNDKPAYELDVNGVVAARGRIGSDRGGVKADGLWHDITSALDGCHAFEVMAGVGDKESGRYALLNAVAINAFNRNGKINSQQSHFGSRCDKIELRWRGETHAYTLQIRTRCAYGDHVAIQYFLTDLWFDPFMQASDTRQSGALPGSAS